MLYSLTSWCSSYSYTDIRIATPRMAPAIMPRSKSPAKWHVAGWSYPLLWKRNWTAQPCFILTLRHKNAMRLAHPLGLDYVDQNALRTSPLLLLAPGLPLVWHGQLKRRSRQGGFRLTAVSSVFKTLGRTVRLKWPKRTTTSSSCC